jgi:4-amino-4-deoxy-L-arabinose transferase-like glycosyltransferase
MTKDNWKASLAGLVVLAALGLICPLLAARYIPLVDPDEGLHASIAQEMVERGDWVVPRQLQDPFLDKPILYFWAIAASIKCFGSSEAAVRLPGLLFGLLGTITTVAVAWRTLGRRTGLVAGIFYASMVMPLALVQVPAHDVALVPWVNLAVLCFWEADRAAYVIKARRASEADARLPRSRVGLVWLWTALAGFVLGLTILTKGLAGVALSGIAYGGYLVLSRQLKWVHCLRAAMALTIAAIVGSAWYCSVEVASPGFIRYYFFERHVLGFLTNSQPHGTAPWWYYFPILLVGGLPWIGYLPVLLRDWVDRWRQSVPADTDDIGRRPVLLYCCWFIGGTLFLTASHSKLITYIWPVFPAVATLGAIVWVRLTDGSMSAAGRRWMSVIVWATCLLGPFALPVTFAITQVAVPTQFSRVAWAVAIAAGLTSIVPLWAWLAGRLRLTVGLATATVCCQLAVLLWFAFPQTAEALSARELAMHFNRTREMPSRMILSRERVGSVLFYLDPELRAKLQPGQIANLDVGDPLPQPPMGTNEWVAIPERHIHSACRDFDLEHVPYEKVDGFRLFRRSDLEPRTLVSRVSETETR